MVRIVGLLVLLGALASGCGGAAAPEGRAARAAPQAGAEAPPGAGSEAPEPPAEPPEPEPEPLPQPPSDLRATLTVTIDPEASVLEVEHELPLGWAGRALSELCLVFDEPLALDEGEDGYAQFVEPVEPDGLCRETAEGTVVTRYRVRLEHHERSPSHGIEDAPHPTDAGWFLLGRAFVPRLRFGEGRSLDLPVDVRFELPEGWRLLASARSEGTEVPRPDIRSAKDTAYYVGEVEPQRIEAAGVEVLLVSASFEPDALEPLTELVRRTLETAREALGEPPSRRVLVSYERTEATVGGGVVGDSVAVRSDRPPSGHALDPEGHVVVHELMHLWNRSDAYWLHEGGARYLEILIGSRVDGASPSVALAELLRSYGRYREQAGGRAIGAAEASMGGWPYAAGAVLSFCTDVELRRHGSDWLQAHRRARAASEEGIELAAWLAAIEAESAEVAARVRELLRHPVPIDFPRCLRRAGYELRAIPYREPSERDLQRLLRVRTLRRWPPTVLRSRPASAFEDGDRLLAVDGEPLYDLDAFGAHVRRAEPGDRLQVRVRRGGREGAIAVTVPYRFGEDGEPAVHFEAVSTASEARRFLPFGAAAAEGARERTDSGSGE